MISVANFPVELLEHILTLAGNPVAQTQVCWKFNAIATPILYRNILLLYRTNSVHDIHLLVRTIISRPALGEHARRLNVQLADGDDDETWRGHEDNLTKFSLEGESRGLSSEIQREILVGSSDAMLFLLLCYLPSLQTLNVQALDLMHRAVFDHMSSSVLLPSALQSLHSASISYCHPYINYQVNEDYIIPFFHLPTLRSFSCLGVDIDAVGVETKFPFRSSSVEEITLQQSIVDEELLTAMVRSSRALRSLTYDFSGIMISPPSTLVRVLRECAKDTLVRLHLEFPENSDSEPPTGSLGSLREFSQLAHASAPLSMMVGTPDDITASPLRTLLPNSLVSLGVWIDKRWETSAKETTVQMFVELFASERDKLGNLNELRIGGSIASSDLENIRSTCVKENVTFFELSRCAQSSSYLTYYHDVYSSLDPFTHATYS
jgi:hypothetical protein